MIRFFAALLLVMASLASADSQESLYYRALKAEEAGDIPRALDLFDSAVAESGPYTDEIQEIINDYREVLGDSGIDSAEELSQGTWKFHTYGKVGYTGLHYKKESISNAETGSEMSASVTAAAEYESENWDHSFEFNASGDWFADKDSMPSLDTSAWETSLGIGYSLIGNSLILDLGVDATTTEDENWTPEFYIWAEKYYAHLDKHKFGIAGSTYKKIDGPTSTAFYASWHRFVKYGWRSSLYLGGRYEADSASSLYLLKWFGPSLKPSVSYRFRTNISIDTKLSVFYGFVVNGSDTRYEELQKLNGSWTCYISWKPGIFGLFAGAEQLYRFYINNPSEYSTGYPKWSVLTELKAGIRWDL